MRVFSLSRLVIATAVLLASCALGYRGTAAASRPTRIVYAALGASDTVGLGATNPARDNWTAQLARRFPRGTRYINLGHSGATLGGALTSELPPALAMRPTVATVWLAVNDIDAFVTPSNYGAEMDRLLGALDRAHVRVFVGNVPDLRLVPDFQSIDPNQIDEIVRGYNGAIAAAAARHHAVLVDLYGSSRALLGHAEYISGDGFHPSTRGYAILAGLFYRVMHAHGAV